MTTASVPDKLGDATAFGVLWQATPGRFLLNLPGVARYLVEEGTTITVDPAPSALESNVKYFQGMLPDAALAYQRGQLALHAAAVSNGDVTVLLAGDSGCGKSTLLAKLLKCGWRMLADEMTIVEVDNQGNPVVYPNHHGIALWPDSLKHLGIASDSLLNCDENRQEYSPLPEQFESNPQRLCGIYRLGVSSKSVIEFEEIEGSARFQTIGTMLYNSHVADALCDRANYLRYIATISQSVVIKNLRRPRGVWSVDALAELICA